MALSDTLPAPTGRNKTVAMALLRLFAPISTVTGKVQWAGIAILFTMILLAVFAPLVSSYAPKDLVCEPFDSPTAAHILGCNDVGQDLFSQLLHGARVSLFVGILVASLSTLIATILALLAGYHAGREDGTSDTLSTSWIDKIIMRMVDVALSLPFLPLVIVLGVYFGASIQTQILVITLVMWAHPVRELRAQILSIRAATFVEASTSMGANARFIGLKHILPELAPLIVPQFVRIAHNAILVEAALSFLGLGDPLQNSWGSILFHANARTAFLTGAWTYWIMPPGLAIGLTVLSFAFIGYGFDASISSHARRAKSRRVQKGTIEPAQKVSSDQSMQITDLSVSYPTQKGTHHAVQSVSLSLEKGELLGLVGESGSGKSTIALSILQLLRQPADITSGQILFAGHDLLKSSDDHMRRLRATALALIPQSAMNALNPVLTIGEQLKERLELIQNEADMDPQREALFWIEQVGLSEKHLHAFPHELSGGMRQRAVIAIALCSRPDLVIADEPTTGLDVLVQESIMQLLLSLRERFNLTILFVTHNLPLIARHCDRLAVMHQGRIVETGSVQTLREAPSHSHTKALFASLPDLKGEKLWPGMPTASMQDTYLLDISNVSKSFRSARNLLMAKKSKPHMAASQISLQVQKGEVVGLVGGSGAGKSTIARLVMGSLKPDEGQISFEGQPISTISASQISRKIHMVYQDPYQSLNNRLTIRDLIAEPLLIHEKPDWQSWLPRIRHVLELVRLPNDDDFLNRLPISLSGGQRQRVAFARAIITNPSLIIADEPTSMLDQSIRLDVMDVMDRLRRDCGTAFLFITHDIALARHFCDRLVVLKDGQIVEQGNADMLVGSPNHPYTCQLIEAV